MATAQTVNNYQKKPDTTSNVRIDRGDRDRKKPRINDDWQYLEKPELSNHPTTDQKFKLRYQHSGLGNIKIDKPKKAEQTTDQYGNPVINYNSKVVVQTAPVAPIIKTPRLKGRALGRFSVEARIKKKAAVAIARVVKSIHIGYWPAVQLTLGVFTIIGFGSAVATSSVINGSSDDGFVASVTGFVAGTANDIVSYVTGFGFDDVTFMLFLIPYLILSVSGLVVTFIVLFLYSKAGVESLRGRRSGTKWGLFALTIVCYLLPIVNMFPWILGWTYVVAKYPR